MTCSQNVRHLQAGLDAEQHDDVGVGVRARVAAAELVRGPLDLAGPARRRGAPAGRLAVKSKNSSGSIVGERLGAPTARRGIRTRRGGGVAGVVPALERGDHDRSTAAPVAARSSAGGRSSCRVAPPRRRLEVERQRVDAVAQAGGLRAVGEDVAEVAAAAGAGDLDAAHAVADVLVGGDVGRRRPARRSSASPCPSRTSCRTRTARRRRRRRRTCRCPCCGRSSPVNAGSVPLLRSTSYCSGVSSARHSSSDFSTFSTMAARLRAETEASGGGGGWGGRSGARRGRHAGDDAVLASRCVEQHLALAAAPGGRGTGGSRASGACRTVNGTCDAQAAPA